MPERGKQFSEDPDEYRLPGDEKPKTIKWEKEHPDETVHLRRRYQLPTSKPYDPYHDPGPYQYGKRPKGWKR